MTEKKRMRFSAGVTLIELIVVIAIMAILMTVAGVGISYLIGEKSKDAAYGLEAALSRVRTAGMSKEGSHYLKLYLDDKGCLFIDSSEESVKQIGKSGVKVSYRLSESTEEKELVSGDVLTFTYKQTTGAFTGVTYESVTIHGGGASFKLTMYKTTGKVELTRV